MPRSPRSGGRRPLFRSATAWAGWLPGTTRPVRRRSCPRRVLKNEDPTCPIVTAATPPQ
jgi:hypothetical protein